jgi:hypothetical protein
MIVIFTLFLIANVFANTVLLFIGKAGRYEAIQSLSTVVVLQGMSFLK